MSARKRGSGDRQRQRRADRGRARRRATSQRAASELELGRSLDLLAARRAPYAGLLADLVATTLARFPPPDRGPIVEIGAGTGQLRTWLPSAIGVRTLHTDPSLPALGALRAGAPDAPIAAAAAERLPITDRAVAGVAALCVFDALADASAAVAEIARVLPPGGRFWHFLDMATLLEAPFAKLAASHLVPIPNVLGDPGAHEWPLDILLLDRDWLLGLLDFARSVAHPLATAFAPSLAPFLAPAFDPIRAAKAFKALASSGDRRHAFMTAFVSASRLAIERGTPSRKPLPFHSGKYLKSVLDAAFTAGGRFAIELSEIVTRAAIRPAEGAVRYRSLCLGHERVMTERPDHLLGPAAAASEGQMLVEAGLYAFVARKLG